jgi:hypothetical protein
LEVMDKLPIVERLEESATAFRQHPIYTQDGDPVLLTTQANELSQAATTITELVSALEAFAEFGAWAVDTEGWINNVHREGISVWFGPSDFRRAVTTLSTVRGETK